MGKRRNAKKKTCVGAEGSATHNNIYGGGSDRKFSAFEFAEDDSRVEIESRKTLAKFGTKSPSKKPLHHRQPVDKYVFLECFAHGATSKRKDTANDILNVDDTHSIFQDTTFGTDITMSLASLNYESKTVSSPKFQGYDSCGAKPYAPKSRKPGCYAAGKKHNKIFHVESDGCGRMQFGSFNSSLNLEENEGLLEEQSAECGTNSNDCEALVVFAPYYVKYGKKYYKRCRLTFSRSCVRLEGSPFCDPMRTHCLEWSTLDILNIEYQKYGSVKADVVNLHIKSKDINVDETGIWSSGIVELEFVVLDDPRWPEKQEEIISLDLKYKAAWKTNVTECSFRESFDNMVYPHGDPDAVLINRSDIELLQPRTFINDTIIDFYIKYLLNKIKPEEQYRFHFFNTFFFRKLAAVCQDSSRAWEGRDAFQSVHKWTRNVKIFEADYIFVPVNFSLHWSLIIICHPGEVVNLRDKVLDESFKVPCILHMDSIRGSHGGLENLIRSYLWEEWKERGNTHEEDIKMKFLNLEFISLQPPQQENFFDCGLFLLHYVELFLEQASNFSKTKYSDILNKDWFHPAEVSLRKRDHIRKLIHRIVEDNALDDPPATACDDKYLKNFGIDEGDGDANLKRKNSAKESSCVVKFNSSDDFDIKGQQSSVVPFGESAAEECFELYNLQVPIYQLNNLSVPMEKEAAFQEHIVSGQGGIRSITSRCHHHIDSPMPSSCQQQQQLNSDLGSGEMEDLLETDSEAWSDKSLIINDVQNEQDCGGGGKSSMSSEDLEACVVEDSEDETSSSGSIPRTRRSSFLILFACFV